MASEEPERTDSRAFLTRNQTNVLVRLSEPQDFFPQSDSVLSRLATNVLIYRHWTIDKLCPCEIGLIGRRYGVGLLLDHGVFSFLHGG